ncbi:MAG: VWA domain-containing protein [Planctomycetes bacterium]|nr:VWA domain-containing protein [Planctomycetota bacterium]
MSDTVSQRPPISTANGRTTPSHHEGSAPLVLSGRAVVSVWMISILLHLCGLAVMFVVVFPFAAPEPTEESVVHVELVGDPEATSFSASAAPDQTAQRLAVEPKPAHFTPERFEKLAGLSNTAKTDLPILGVGTGGGDFSKFGLTVGGGVGPSFFGLGGTARGAKKIVYVVDRSGSMLDTFGHVRAEMRRSISALRRSQKFHVIFFNSGQPLENSPQRLVSAIRAQKEKFYRFLQGVYPEGSTDPAPAMRRAFATEPDLIYFLTDGEFDASLVSQLDRWNKDKSVKIFTIAYFDRSGAALLETIARNHGGRYKFVSENDLP